MKRPTRGTHWQPAETRIVENGARRLLAGHYTRLSAATEDCLSRLRDWYAARPETPESDRVYPRTISAVRNKVYKAAVLRGYRMSRLLWSRPERRLAYKWAKKFLRRRKAKPPLARLDAGQGLLVELFTAGYDRTLDACTMEPDKCQQDIVQGVSRRCGRGSRAVSLPASVLPGKASAHRAAASHTASSPGASKAKHLVPARPTRRADSDQFSGRDVAPSRPLCPCDELLHRSLGLLRALMSARSQVESSGDDVHGHGPPSASCRFCHL